jgi:hypothetical protein
MVVLFVILTISAYSLYFVARHLGVPKIFAMGMSTAYDGTALLAADKSLQYAQEGRSGAVPRAVMIVFAGLSAWLNSLHAILGSESPLAIPMWAGLPIAAATVFELHTSQARAKALARQGKKYPAPLPSWGGVTWLLFPAKTLLQLKSYVAARSGALAITQEYAIEDGLNERTLPRNNPEWEANERTGPERTNERPARRPNGTNGQVLKFGRAGHAPERHIREWARTRGYKVGVRGAIPEWIKAEYAAERRDERTNAAEGTDDNERTADESP